MLEIKHLSYRVEDESGTADILRDVNLTIDDKRFVVITGPNGGGKPSLARTVMGINPVTSGSIFWNGKDITALSVTERARLGISYGFQQPPRFKGMKVRDLLAGNLDTPNARIHNAPVAQTAEGLWLGERTEVHAMTDLSDGLASDLRHIAEQSHVGATVDLERIPIAPDSDLVTALTGGEDYKLLFTAAPEALPALCRAFESRFGRPLYPIGTVTEAEDDTIVWLDRGRRVETDWRGYEHNA